MSSPVNQNGMQSLQKKTTVPKSKEMALLKEILHSPIVRPGTASPITEVSGSEDNTYSGPILVNDKARWVNPNTLTIVTPSQPKASYGFLKATKSFIADQRIRLGKKLECAGNTDLHHEIGSSNNLALTVRSAQYMSLTAADALQNGFSGAKWAAEAEREAMAAIEQLGSNFNRPCSHSGSSEGGTEEAWDKCE